MDTNAIMLNIDGERTAELLKTAREQLGNANNELILDFSNVQRLDAPGLRAFEELVAAAEEKSITLVLHSANVDVYKVLKLVKLAPKVTLVHS